MFALGSGAGSTIWSRIWRISRWILLALAVGYIALVIYRIPAVRAQQLSQQTVAQIKNQHLTMDDVDGKHLPPPPDPNQVDATIAGIDANQNGIRDDVELAIFAKYPISSATSTALRAAELQYAMELQNELTNVFDSATWVAMAKSENDGISCLVKVSFEQHSDSRDQILQSDALQKEVEAFVFNTVSRQNKRTDINSMYQTYFAVGEGKCDIPLTTLPT